MNKIFLPKLVRIEINNYSLYKQQPSFTYDFKSGINAIIGVNGIGKTTFIELILYCLIGFKREYKLNKRAREIQESKLNISYFSSRRNDDFSNEDASAELTFKARQDIIKISRSLFNDEILYVEVNGHKNSFKEEEYNNYLLKKLNLSNFEALQTIIRNFLVFDEQRLNVAWEMENQDKILRILLLEEKLYENFDELEKNIVKLDSEGRHLSEDRRIVRERLADLDNERKKLLTKVKKDEGKSDENIVNQNLDYNELIGMKNALQLEISTIEEETELLLNKIENHTYEINKYIGERNSLTQEMESIDIQVSKSEAKLYSSIYNRLPDYYLPLEKSLVNDGKCLVCNSKSIEIKEKFRSNKNAHSCIVCSSHLKDELELDPNIINNLNELNDKRENLIVKIKNSQDDIDKSKGNYYPLDNEVKILAEIKEQKTNKLIQIESLVSHYKKDMPSDTYSQLVKSLDNQIYELTKKVDKTYQLRDIAQKQLDILYEGFVAEITKLNKELSFYFNKYASTFIGLKCELTLKRQIIRFIPHIKFLPKVDGDERTDIDSVSESQRFFLDQAFRMAIIDFLQNNNKGFETFFITETPEGSLDMAYEEQVAKMFSLFAQSNNNIVFTSNLNSSNFLFKTFEGIDRDQRKHRILNMLEKGNLTKVQEGYKHLFKTKLEKILGEESKYVR